MMLDQSKTFEAWQQHESINMKRGSTSDINPARAKFEVWRNESIEKDRECLEEKYQEA